LGGIKSSNSGEKIISNLRRADMMPTAGEVVRGNGRCLGCGVVAKVTNPTLKGFDGAEVSRSAAQANDLTTYTILLSGEFKSAKGGGSK
jgi:hypothetical protein